MDHRIFLSMDHPFHHKEAYFNKEKEWGQIPLHLAESEILEKIQNIPRNWEKLRNSKKKKKKK